MMNGFNFAIKISRTTGSKTEYIDELWCSTAVNFDTYPYPEDYVDVVLQNVADGSEYWIYNNTRILVVASGTQSGTDDITISGVEYWGSDDTLTIRVRKGTSTPKYKPFTTQATLTSNGAIVYVSQIEDQIA